MVLETDYRRTSPVSSTYTNMNTSMSMKELIYYSIENDLFDTAQFTSERLLASCPSSPELIYLYSLVLFKSGRYKAAFNASADNSGVHVGCSYIFAKSCLKLKQESQGIRSLLKTMNIWKGIVKSTDRYSPDSNACYMVLAKLYNQVNDIPRATMHYANILKLNPFIFEAFESLCLMGVNVKVDSLYKLNSDSNSILVSDQILEEDLDISSVPTRKVSGSGAVFGFPSSSNITSSLNSGTNNVVPAIHVPDDERSFKSSIFKTPKTKNSKYLLNITPKTPAISTQSNDLHGASSIQMLNSNAALNQGQHSSASGTTYDPSLLLTPNTKLSHYQMSSTYKNKRPNGSNGIKTGNMLSSRLIPHGFSSNNTATNASKNIHNVRPSNISSIREPANSNNNSKRGISLTFGHNKDVLIDRKPLLENNNEIILTTYAKLAKAFKAMCDYDSFRAIRMFDSLPENERNTPWVLSKLGKLHFEIVNYEEAEQYFIKLRKIDRTRLIDMEYYSTLLWHLHKEVDLSFLSHELFEIDPNAPQTWIAIGNLFSFKRESDEAIKCFQKATKVDETFIYAYTLQGHEYLASDAFEKALECFRKAIVLDNRHYNAFYGIGMAYLKLGDFTKAEFYFRKAVNINPVNVILICCTGIVLEKLGKRDEALSSYIHASKLQPLSMLALFKKAQLLFIMKQYDEALVDFEKLQDMVPDEASVHFLLGKLYKHFNRKNDAIKQFTIALNLDPKGSHLIKEALETLDD